MCSAFNRHCGYDDSTINFIGDAMFSKYKVLVNLPAREDFSILG